MFTSGLVIVGCLSTLFILFAAAMKVLGFVLRGGKDTELKAEELSWWNLMFLTAIPVISFIWGAKIGGAF